MVQFSCLGINAEKILTTPKMFATEMAGKITFMAQTDEYQKQS